MSSNNFIKNITSKDSELSKDTIATLINSGNLQNYNELLKNSDFIFPFLKERIVKEFVNLVNENNLDTIFEFSKFYSSDFEDIVVESWVKFANQDLTDRIIELFEIGTNEQKAHAARYFTKILDVAAVEYLNILSNSSYLPLKINCAQALSAFGDKTSLNKMMTFVLDSKDEFEKVAAFEFISAYGGDNSIKFIIRNGLKSPFSANIAATLLDYNDFDVLKSALEPDEILKLFNVIIEAYPENISLDTIMYYQIFDFIKYINTFKTQYAFNILLMTKIKIEEFYNNDAYIFDLDKNIKNELKKIHSYLDSLDLSTSKMELELETSKNESPRFDCALEVIKEYKLVENSSKITELVNSRTLKPQYLVKCIYVLKELNKTDAIKKIIIDEIEDINIKTLIESYL